MIDGFETVAIGELGALTPVRVCIVLADAEGGIINVSPAFFTNGSVVKPAAAVVMVVVVETMSCTPTTNITTINATANFRYQRGLFMIVNSSYQSCEVEVMEHMHTTAIMASSIHRSSKAMK